MFVVRLFNCSLFDCYCFNHLITDELSIYSPYSDVNRLLLRHPQHFLHRGNTV